MTRDSEFATLSEIQEAMSRFKRLLPGRCGICGNRMNKARQNLWVCKKCLPKPKYRYISTCSSCDVYLFCRDRIAKNKCVLCEHPDEGDFLRGGIFPVEELIERTKQDDPNWTDEELTLV